MVCGARGWAALHDIPLPGMLCTAWIAALLGNGISHHTPLLPLFLLVVLLLLLPLHLPSHLPSPPQHLHSWPAGIPPLEIGQMRRCKVLGTSIFDLEATPVA